MENLLVSQVGSFQVFKVVLQVSAGKKAYYRKRIVLTTLDQEKRT